MWRIDLPAEVFLVDTDMAVGHEGRSEISVHEAPRAASQAEPLLMRLSDLSGPWTNKANKEDQVPIEPRSGGATRRGNGPSLLMRFDNCIIPSRQPSTPPPPKHSFLGKLPPTRLFLD